MTKVSRVKLFDDDSFASAALARGVPAFVLVNPIEYHGPHLSLRNDHLVSMGLAKDLHAFLRARSGERDDGLFPFLPTRDLDVGVEPASGPGSVPVSFDAVKAKVLSACRELRRLGAHKVVFVTFHGSPLHTTALEAGVSWLREHGIVAFSPMSLLLHELVDVDPRKYARAYEPVADDHLRARLAAGMEDDFHAGFFETSLALHYAPESVRAFYTEVPDCPPFAPPRVVSAALRLVEGFGFSRAAKELSLVARGAAWMGLRPFPGYTSAPRHANAASGRVFAGMLIDLFGAAAEDVLSGGIEPPRPPLGWLAYVTLFGRIGVHAAPSDMLHFPTNDGPAGFVVEGAHGAPA